jgi:hypothetical protein
VPVQQYLYDLREGTRREPYYSGAGYHSENAGSVILLIFLASFGILGFSIIGAQHQDENLGNDQRQHNSG